MPLLFLRSAILFNVNCVMPQITDDLLNVILFTLHHYKILYLTASPTCIIILPNPKQIKQNNLF